jgi:hypothetical protein
MITTGDCLSRKICDEFPSIRFFSAMQSHGREYTIFYRSHYRSCNISTGSSGRGSTQPTGRSYTGRGTNVKGGRESRTVYCNDGTETKSIWCIQLNDGYTLLAAEDRLMFGSIGISNYASTPTDQFLCSFLP